MSSTIRRYLLLIVVVSLMASAALTIQVYRQGIQIRELQDIILRLREEATVESEGEPKLQESLDGQVILIGVTTSTEEMYFKMRKFVEEIIEVDANQYSKDLGYNTTFHFILTSNSGTSLSAHLNTQLYYQLGITVIIGHPSNTQSCTSLSYAEAHGMILFSPVASAVSQACSGDSYLRLACNDTVNYILAAKTLLSYGVEACVAIGIDFGYGMFDAFEKEYSRGGGVVLDWVKFEDWEPESTEYYLEWIEAKVIEGIESYGPDKVGVLLMGGSEFVPLVEKADDYTVLYDISWFGCWGTALNTNYMTGAPEESAHLKIFTPVPALPETEEYTELNERYEWIITEPLNFQMACTYDASMITVQAILESQSIEDDVLLDKIPKVASRTHGASGPCVLNKDGDREICDFIIYGYSYKLGKVESIEYGRYDCITDQVTWDIEALGFTP